MFIDRVMDKDAVHIHNGILLTYKKNEIIAFAATRKDLEITILSEVARKRKTNTIYHLYVESNIRHKSTSTKQK